MKELEFLNNIRSIPLLYYLSGIITSLFGLYLVLLLAIAAIKKNTAIRYFSTFASTAKAHYLEQIIRIIIGSSLLIFSSEMLGTWYYYYFGWLLVGTSILLLIIPWQVHHRFGKWAIPLTIKYIWLYASIAAILGMIILYAIFIPIFS
ncbi:hypothetical protein [Ekhidna sp.]|uniref:hypothetical protein n=1 Tax=Ekhidna sp. TaxID=2608089 RepID=UPI003299DE79